MTQRDTETGDQTGDRSEDHPRRGGRNIGEAQPECLQLDDDIFGDPNYGVQHWVAYWNSFSPQDLPESVQEPGKHSEALELEALEPAVDKYSSPVGIGGDRCPPCQGIDCVGGNGLSRFHLDRDHPLP